MLTPEAEELQFRAQLVELGSSVEVASLLVHFARSGATKASSTWEVRFGSAVLVRTFTGVCFIFEMRLL